MDVLPLSGFLLLFEVLALASAVHAIFTVRTPQGTLAWVMGLLAFPWLGVPLYWFFGSRRFDRHSATMRAKVARHRDHIRRVLAGLEPFEVARASLQPPGTAALAELAGLEFCHGNRLTLLLDGQATFDAILGAVARAQRSVHMQFYILRPDGLGNRLLEALAERAAAGVDVRFLIDSLGSAGMTPALRAAWRERGVRLETFCAHSPWRDRWRLNFRNHRKNVVIDGRTGFIGGHNVGDEYLGLDPRFGPWRDTHVQVEGPAVQHLQMAFAADWAFATGEVPEEVWPPGEPCAAGPGEGTRALVLSSGPSDQFERCTLFFLQAIGMARRRLWIASPYFVPDEGVMQALQLAAFRGVDVRLLLPKKPDHRVVWLASFAKLEELDQPNIRIFRYTAGFLHQKALLVDEDFAAVGTANFDNRSFRLNFEMTLAVPDTRFAAQVAAMFERDFAASEQGSARDLRLLPPHLRLAARGARLLSPVL